MPRRILDQPTRFYISLSRKSFPSVGSTKFWQRHFTVRLRQSKCTPLPRSHLSRVRLKHRTEEYVVRQVSIQDILNGDARLPFTSRASWLAIQSECKDLRHTQAYLAQGTRPSKKLTNVKDIKIYLKCHYDQIFDIHFFTFSCTIGLS